MRPPITITGYRENLMDKVYHIPDEHYKVESRWIGYCVSGLLGHCKKDDYYSSKTITGSATGCDNPKRATDVLYQKVSRNYTITERNADRW